MRLLILLTVVLSVALCKCGPLLRLGIQGLRYPRLPRYISPARRYEIECLLQQYGRNRSRTGQRPRTRKTKAGQMLAGFFFFLFCFWGLDFFYSFSFVFILTVCFFVVVCVSNLTPCHYFTIRRILRMILGEKKEEI